jgi:hypothetical protein
VAGGLLVPNLVGHGKLGWDTRESQRRLFSSGVAGSTRSTYPNTSLTLTKWAGTALAPQARLATFKPGTVRGVLTGLLSPDQAGTVQSPVVGQPPGACLVSVTSPGGTNAACSTAAATTGNCSVSTTASSRQQACSTVSPGQPYCSTNTPTGVGGNNGGGPATCSASGMATSSGQNSCSTGGGGTCSTQNNTTQTGGTSSNQCSVGVAGGTSQGQCSSGGLSGTKGATGFCSAAAGNIAGGTQNNTCSVTMSGTSNQCSTDGTAGSSCSTNGGDTPGKTTTDACSVAQNLAHAQCTVFNPGTGGGKCSVDNVNSHNCSVITANGTANPPPAGKAPICGNP